MVVRWKGGWGVKCSEEAINVIRLKQQPRHLRFQLGILTFNPPPSHPLRTQNSPPVTKCIHLQPIYHFLNCLMEGVGPGVRVGNDIGKNEGKNGVEKDCRG